MSDSNKSENYILEVNGYPLVTSNPTEGLIMFNWFKHDERKALAAKLNRTRVLMVRAMQRHGINSPQVNGYDRIIDSLEDQLRALGG